jgi:ABC-type transport system involved in multi-copper enzyme maturation permease subunit
MLWYKSWIDTRWRFLIAFAVLAVMACGVVVSYNFSRSLLPALADRPIDTSTAAGRLIKEALRIEQTYRGWVWVQWFRQNLLQIGTLFAIVLGSGGVISTSTGGLFTLSLPASREDWVMTRAATGLCECFVLATVPSVVLSVLSPIIGQHYSIVDVLVHGVCFFVAAAVFYSVAFLLSTVFHDMWRPLGIAVGIACLIALLEGMLNVRGIFHLMSGYDYFASGSFPWVGLSSSAAVSAALLYGAAANVAHKDF